MRFKIPISLMFALTLLTLNAFAILQPYDISPGGSLAENLINATQGGGILRTHHPDMPPSPKIVRALRDRNLEWKPVLVWTANPWSLSTYSTPRASRTESQGQPTESSAALMPDTTIESKPVEPQNPPTLSTDLSGTWSLDLNDTTSRQVVLTLFQVEDKVFGSGSMKNGNDTLVVTASGEPKGDQIYLDITSIGTIGLYSLVMTLSGDLRDTVSGDYKAYAADGRTWMGKVQGRRMLSIS